MQKIASDDVRDILERASARETAARVAAGGIAKAMLREMGVTVTSCVTAIGDVTADAELCRTASADQVEASEVRCPDPAASELMKRAIDAARSEGYSLGGVFTVTATGLVPGLGTYAEAGDRLDARLAAAVISIPAIKGFEIGDGFAVAAAPGNLAHDEILFDATHGFVRPTNRAGGIEGGMTNGEPVVIRAAMKPIPTLMTPLASVDLDTLEAIDASRERSDVCAVPAAAVVAEAEVAFVLAQAYLDKFGRDAIVDIVRLARCLPRPHPTHLAMSHILLIGFMGAGKSTVGRLLADDRGLEFIDLDVMVETAEGRSVRSIFEDEGEARFRALETEALESLSAREPAVVACGGGIVLSEANRATAEAAGHRRLPAGHGRRDGRSRRRG